MTVHSCLANLFIDQPKANFNKFNRIYPQGTAHNCSHFVKMTVITFKIQSFFRTRTFKIHWFQKQLRL